jgi:hypothetical protein
MAAVGEPSRATIVVARPQQEVVAAAAVQALWQEFHAHDTSLNAALTEALWLNEG